MDKHDAITGILTALIGGGLLTFVRDIFNGISKHRAARTPEAKESLHVTAADSSLLVVSKARDELEADNERLRATLAEERAEHRAAEDRWAAKEATYRSEIENLESRLRGMLDELTSLKTRITAPLHDM